MDQPEWVLMWELANIRYIPQDPNGCYASNLHFILNGWHA